MGQYSEIPPFDVSDSLYTFNNNRASQLKGLDLYSIVSTRNEWNAKDHSRVYILIIIKTIFSKSIFVSFG